MRTVMIYRDRTGLYVRHKGGTIRPIAPDTDARGADGEWLGLPLRNTGHSGFTYGMQVKKSDAKHSGGKVRLQSLDGLRSEWWWEYPKAQAEPAAVPSNGFHLNPAAMLPNTAVASGGYGSAMVYSGPLSDMPTINMGAILGRMTAGALPPPFDGSDRERAVRILDAYQAACRCSRCHVRFDIQRGHLDSAWRWAADHWEHRCPDRSNLQGGHWPAERIDVITIESTALKALLHVAYAAALSTPKPYETVRELIESEISHPISDDEHAALAVPGVKDAVLDWAEAVDHA